MLFRSSRCLIEHAVSYIPFSVHKVKTPRGTSYTGLKPSGSVSAVSVLRGGSCLEPALHRVIPDCRVGRILIQTNYRTGEPELHYNKLGDHIKDDAAVLLLDAQMASGGAALMAVRVLVDHGVAEKNIIFVAYTAGRRGVGRLLSVFPDIKFIAGRLIGDYEERWVETRYLGC